MQSSSQTTKGLGTVWKSKLERERNQSRRHVSIRKKTTTADQLLIIVIRNAFSTSNRKIQRRLKQDFSFHVSKSLEACGGWYCCSDSAMKGQNFCDFPPSSLQSGCCAPNITSIFKSGRRRQGRHQLQLLLFLGEQKYSSEPVSLPLQVLS